MKIKILQHVGKNSFFAMNHFKARSDANVRVMEDQISDFKIRVEEHVRNINDLTIIRNKLVSETSDSSHRLEDAENKVSL